MHDAVDENQFGFDSPESANGFVGQTRAVPKSKFLKSNIQSSRSKRVEIDVEPTGETLTARTGDQIQQNQQEIFSTENTSCSMTLVKNTHRSHERPLPNVLCFWLMIGQCYVLLTSLMTK